MPKHQRRVKGFDEAILFLYAKVLTAGEIQAHLAEIDDVSRDVISRATDKVTEELDAWRNRPLDRGYAVLMIDAIVVEIRDGAVANRPVCLAVGINLEGERDVLGRWVGFVRRGRQVVDGLASGAEDQPTSSPTWSTWSRASSSTPPPSTGHRSPRNSARSAPPPPRTPTKLGSSNSKSCGAGVWP